MPIYEYQCESCGHELEKLQRMADPILTDCPACGQSELKRLVSAAGFRLKGSGWYETDFKKGGKKNLHDSDGSKDGEAKQDTSDSKSTTKTTEAKPKNKEASKSASTKTNAA